MTVKVCKKCGNAYSYLELEKCPNCDFPLEEKNIKLSQKEEDTIKNQRKDDTNTTIYITLFILFLVLSVLHPLFILGAPILYVSYKQKVKSETVKSTSRIVLGVITGLFIISVISTFYVIYKIGELLSGCQDNRTGTIVNIDK